MPRASQARPAAPARAELIPRIVIFAGVATVVTGLSIKAATDGLGTRLPPFVLGWSPRAGPLAPLSAAVLVAAVPLGTHAARIRRRPAAFAAVLFGLAVGLGLSLNLARHGVRDWYAVFDTSPGGSFEASNEYLPGLPALSYGVRFYLDRFAELVPSLPVNVAGHTPGLLLLLHLLGISSAAGMAALCIGVGGLVPPLTYDLARTQLDEQQARAAGLLAAFAPSLLLFGVTSADYLYATLGLAAACLLVRPAPGIRGAGAGLAAVAAFFSWLLLAIPAWTAIVVCRREGLRNALLLAGGCAAAVLALNVLLALGVGYDPLGALRATGSVYRHSLATRRPYAFWLLGSPTAWGAMLGLPTIVLATRSVARRQPAALALAVVVVVSAVLGFTKAETERIWLPFVPLACVAAASALNQRNLRRVLAGLAAQALAVELLFDTIW